MSSDTCPHCDRPISADAATYCTHCGQALDGRDRPRDPFDSRRRIPRAPDVKSSGWSTPKWGLVLGIVWGVMWAISKLPGQAERGTPEDLGIVTGGALAGALFGYLFGLLIEKVL